MYSLARDVLCSIRCKEFHSLRNILHSTEMIEWYLGEHLAPDLLRQDVRHITFDEARGHCVDRDAFRCQLTRHRFCDAVNAGLGRDIVRLARIAQRTDNACDIDASPAVLSDHRPSSTLYHI